MTIETVKMGTNGLPPRVAVPLSKKLNPIWWLQGPDGWEVPTTNNGAPYLPDVTNVWLRRFYWFICRNPLMNFVGFVIGVEDKNYLATGSAPVLRTTGRDCDPQQLGWRWAILLLPFSVSAAIATIILGLAAWLLSLYLLWPALCVALRVLGPLPYISYWGPLWRSERYVEFYLGWRPYSGGFGFKIVLPEKLATQMNG